MSLTKQDIANTLVKKTELTQTQALALTNQFFEQIIETLKTGEEIKLSSFGNFVVREKTPRPGRNPKTGEEVLISARKVVTFKAGPKLKSATRDAICDSNFERFYGCNNRIGLFFTLLSG